MVLIEKPKMEYDNIAGTFEEVLEFVQGQDVSHDAIRSGLCT